MPAPYSAATQLLEGFGLGDNLRQQTQDQIEEEKRRKRLGLSPLAQGPGSAAAAFLSGAAYR